MAFVFSLDNLNLAKQIITRYPDGRQKSAVLPLLHLAQKQNNNYISDDIIVYIADFLQTPVVKIKEVVSFYTMFNQKPIGKYLIQICSTLPCMLRNSEELEKVCENYLGIKVGETTKDNLFTFVKLECLGDCSNAPVVQINGDYYDNLDGDKFIKLLDSLKQANI